jgi:hypothetical protein
MLFCSNNTIRYEYDQWRFSSSGVLWLFPNFLVEGYRRVND